MTTDQQNPDPSSPLPSNNGYETEGGTEMTVREEPAKRSAGKGKSMDELKANFNTVFGHGAGKLGLIAAGVVVLVGTAFAVRGLSPKDPLPEKTTQVDVPGAPTTEVSVDAISPKEAERRASQSSIEAQAAAAAGQSYQPAFDPNIAPAGTQQSGATGTAQPSQLPGQTQASAPIVPSPDGAQTVQVTVPAGQAGQAVDPAEEQRRQAAITERTGKRDAYVGEVRRGVLKSVDELLGEGKGSIRNTGTYSSVSYMPQVKAANAASSAPTAATAAAPGAGVAANSGAKIAFKAGKTIFAETDGETNTDDGAEVFATVRGGPYDGSKLIGKVEIRPRNIGVRFTVLAPQDDRPTMTINAVAIREEDARQGVADSIDNHTLSRYGALFTASILGGLGKAAAQPQGSVIILPNGQSVSQQDEVSGRRIAMYALGEVGANASGEMRKVVDQPATYTINARRGLGVIFLTDVTLPK
ncbi:intracellular multiplication protein IcmE [Massilia sp. MP_M2]|uniref:DotG/IcmE/VirB10 family protein n=1 Tax=Massilia sp. MP_M2 TaxID=3071713 RepID=UPI00319E2E4B